MSVAITPLVDRELQLLRSHRDELVRSLEKLDLLKFSEELCKCEVITQQVTSDFAALDCDRLDSKLRVRFILQQVFDKVRQDRRQDRPSFHSFLDVLSSFGREVKRVYDLLNEIQVTDRCLTEEDIPDLIHDLADVAHKWEEISIALRLPARVREDHRSRGSSIVKLSNILNHWIAGNYLQPVTISTLKKVLAEPLVGLRTTADKLSIDDPLPDQKRPRLDLSSQDFAVRITYRSIDTKVAYGMSTLLEVQVNSNSLESYQWTKDGLKLSDGNFYQGTTSSILIINNASQHVEGKYVCCVDGTITSNEMLLIVIYPDNIKYLRSRYMNLREVPQDSWPPIGTETFIELALINRKDIKRDYDYSIQGNTDDILSEKENINYLDAFGRYESGAVILIEGRPGCGKTTLAHKITKDWTVGENILIGAKLVFLVSLRVLNSSRRDGNLSQLLEIFYDDDEIDVKNVSSYLVSEQGEGVCFLFDGLDEYQAYNRKIETVFKKLVEGKLSKAMIMVFSRPVGSAQLRRTTNIAKRIEILGFKKEQIYGYIDKYFQNSDKALELKEYLKFHINVLHMCYLPVHAAMICLIYSESEDEIPTTETKIYECFTMLTIIRKLRRDDESSTQPISLHNLDAGVQEQFNRICQLAFEMTSSSKQVFLRNDSNLQLTDGSGSDGPSLGLVTVDSTAKLYEYNDLYAFLHLTFQEYLAAFHIFQLDGDKQLSIVEKHRNKAEMLVVWKFYCGMIDFQDKKNLSQLQIIFMSKKVDNLYRVHCAFESQEPEVCDAVLEERGSLSFRNNYFTPNDYNAISYVISAASYPTTKLKFYSCRLDEDGVRHLLKAVNIDRLGSVKTLLFHRRNTTLDQFKVLNLLLTKMSALEYLNLYKTTLSKNSVQILTKNVSLLHLKYLEIQMPFKYRGNCYDVLQLLRFNSPVLEDIQCNHYSRKRYQFDKRCMGCMQRYSVEGHSAEVHLSNQELNLQYNLDIFPCCTTFLLINCGIDDHIITWLAEALEKSKSIEKLVLDYNRISGEGATALAANLQCHAELKHLSAHCNLIDDDGAKALADALGKCTALVHLDLECNSFGDEGAVAIARAVKGLNMILYLWNDNITELGAATVLNCISTANIHSPKGIDFHGVDIDNEKCLSRALQCCTSHQRVKLSLFSRHSSSIISAISDQLKCFNNLKELQLNDNNISLASVAALAGGLKSCTNLQTLNIEGNGIGSEGAAALAGGLKSCTNLQTLNIEGNGIGSEGAAALAGGLKSCTNLQTLNIEGNGIGSEGAAALADGLKSCTNLQKLNVGRNSIGSEGAVTLADVLEFYLNLRTLNIEKNGIGSEGARALADGLKSCINLQTLDISFNSIGSEGATALADGLKSCTKLQTLNIAGNGIGSEGARALADGLKSCTNLQTLDISFNSIDSEGATVLADGLKSCTNLQTLNIAENGIGSEGARALADGLKSRINLQTLDISFNSIGSEGATVLADGLESCTNLQKLNVGRNSIGSEGAVTLADVLESYLNLRTLNIERNGIGSEGARALADGLKSCTNLQTLDISFNSIGSEGATVLADGLKSCTNLQTLNIQGNDIGSAGARALADGLKSCINLQTLYIQGNGIGSEGARALADGLESCTNLQKLNVGRNSIGSEGAVTLADVLESYLNLRTLNIERNGIGLEGARALADGLKSCINLQILDMSYNSIGSEGATVLADGLKSCTKLQTLDIAGNGIGSEGARALADGLKSCTNLQTLNIQGNGIGSEGATALADGLESCTNLQKLNVGRNSIGSEGAVTLADVLESYLNLRTLNIESNGIGSEGARALADGLKSCTNLQTRDISFNSIGSEGATVLADGLKSCTNLQTLNIKGNDIGSEGARALADGLKSCINLQTLDISYNSIGSEGATALADGLKSCTNLQTLNIHGNDIGSEGARALADGLKSCTKLQTLCLLGNGIGSEGARALADGLKSCTNLQTLNIQINDIGSEGARALADGLKSCTNLQH